MIMLLSVNAEISKEDCFKHIDFPFVAEASYDKLIIRYTYSPKKYDGTDALIQAEEAFKEAYGGLKADIEEVKSSLPLNNHVTLSLSKEGVLIGTAHRHASDTVIEVGAASTPGFCSTSITAGNYSVTLSCHAVLSDRIIARVEVHGV